MITLLKQFTWAAANNDVLQTGWIRVPEKFQNWQLVCLVHGRTSGTAATANALTSWDMTADSVINPSVFNLATIGPTVQNVTSGVGPFVQLRLEASADSVVTISFFLTPKTN